MLVEPRSLRSHVPTCRSRSSLILDSDYAASVFYFIQNKSESDLAMFHWKRNFDLYLMVHTAYNLWPQRTVSVRVVKSHCLDSANDPLERYYRLGNEFADLAAKTIAQEQGFVEYFQTRSSVWRYNDDAEDQWKSFYEWCYAVAQRFLNADEQQQHHDGVPHSSPENVVFETIHIPHSSSCPDRSHVIKNIDLFDYGDPCHRRRQMSSYGATYNRCLLAFLTSITWKHFSAKQIKHYLVQLNHACSLLL